MKFINLFPEIKPQIQEVLRSDTQLRNSDAELQQRAVEYLKLSSVASIDVLVCCVGVCCVGVWCMGVCGVSI